MVFEHHQKAIAYITQKMSVNPEVCALLISGSIAHGFNDEHSDVDINIVVSNELYEQKKAERRLTYYEDAGNFYEGGYFDGKYITLDYLDLVAKQGNEPTKFALHDSSVAFDKTNTVENYLKKISTYDCGRIQENTIRFLSQLDGWKWYAEEALRRQNQYLLDLSVSKLILFGGRLILLDNRIFFPYHKWFMKVLENAPAKPPELISSIEVLLKDKSPQNIETLYKLVKKYKDWTKGEKYSWTSNFVHDVETIWMRGEEFIETI